MSRTITVVIPAHNAGRYLARALASVRAQVRRPDQVIVIDDGSTDDTAAIADADPDVELIRQANAGASVARNAGIQAARGEWIAFLDADDEWLPEHLALHEALLDRNPHLVWSTGNFYWCYCEQGHRQRVDLNGPRLDRIRTLLAGRSYFDSYFVAHANFATGHTDTTLIRKDMLVEAGLFHAGQVRMNDMDMWFRLAYRHPAIGFVLEPTAVYHFGVPDGITKRYRDPAILCEFIDRHMAMARQSGHDQAFRHCAAKMVGWWIHDLLEEGQGRDTRRLLRCYAALFDRYFVVTNTIKSFWPAAGRFYDRVSQRLGAKRRKR